MYERVVRSIIVSEMSGRVNCRGLCPGWGSVALACLLVWSLRSSAGAAEGFSMTNFISYSELERTNPAMPKAQAEKWHVQQ